LELSKTLFITTIENQSAMNKPFVCFLLLITLMLSYETVIAQDYSWWNEKHNWDGVTHWSRYIIISPSYMGPNALPVPDINTGIISDDLTLDIGADGHFSKGDKTTNLYTKIFIPLATNKVGLNLSWIPVEYYHMDTITRDIRRARDYDGKGFSVGDLTIGTYIQILKEKDRFPDLLLSINLRTASGSNLSAARFTDSPGYHFDLSFGKKRFKDNSRLEYINLYGMIGLYVYQSHYSKNYQNDAFVYGTGINLGFQKTIIENQFGGYIGYIGDGDKPMVYRLIIRSNRNAKWNYKVMFQQGIHDFDYSTVRLSAVINLTNEQRKKKLTNI